MANKRGQATNSKKLRNSDLSETESADSDGSDWERENQKKTRSLWKRTQDYAQEFAGNRRNLKSEKGRRSGGGGDKTKKRRLGKCEADQDEQPRQCYWVDCVNSARRGSKYCSDECGVKLAKLRIEMILPMRLQEWQATPSIAAEKNQKLLKETEDKRRAFREQFDELEEERQALDKNIKIVSQMFHDPTREAVDEPGSVEDGTASCVICGHEVNTKSYIKHIERCFDRTEKDIAFESKVPSYLPGTRLYCDRFINENASFCKRLAVNCPNHSKKEHFPKNAICGAPLAPKGELNLSMVCKALKSKCQRHYNWDKLRRADIDIRKVVAWTNQEQLQTLEKDLTRQMANRGGVLNLLLHSTKAAKKDDDV